jgi:hypothetical protein
MLKFTLHEGENLQKVFRQANAVLFLPTFFAFLSIFLPWRFLVKYELNHKFLDGLIIWTALVLLWLLNKYFLWLINIYIITNKRLIVLNYKTLLHKVVLETPLNRIHNISSETKGLLGSLLKIGSVVVQIASLSQPLILHNLKQPEKFKDFLWQSHGE